MTTLAFVAVQEQERVTARQSFATGHAHLLYAHHWRPPGVVAADESSALVLAADLIGTLLVAVYS